MPNSKTVLSDHPEPNKGQAKSEILGEARKEKKWRERGRKKNGVGVEGHEKKKERGRGRFNIIPVHTWSKLPDLSKDNSQRRQTH